MTKQVNPNIGHIECPICKAVSAIRQNRSHKLYLDCMNCGRIYPNHGGGQKWLLDNAQVWGSAGAPATVPAWIREQWPYSKSVRHRDFDPANDDQIPADPPADPVTPTDPGQMAQLPVPPPRQQPAANDDAPPDKMSGFGFLGF